MADAASASAKIVYQIAEPERPWRQEVTREVFTGHDE